MKTMIRLMLSLFIILILTHPTMSQDKLINPDEITFKVLYNNIPLNDSFAGDNGLSCLIEIGEHSYLFDAGRIPEILTGNTEALEIDASKIDFIFISHIHSDHIGGLPGIIEKCNRPLLYLPASFPKSQAPKGREYVVSKIVKAKPFVSDTIHIKEAVKLNEYFYSTGMFEDRTYEQALIINTSEGLIILTGCSHPGIVEIVRGAKSLLNREVYLVMGGFHLAVTDSVEVKNIADELRNLTKFIAPCHCTGEKAQEIIKDVFKEDYIGLKTGLSFKASNKN